MMMETAKIVYEINKKEKIEQEAIEIIEMYEAFKKFLEKHIDSHEKWLRYKAKEGQLIEIYITMIHNNDVKYHIEVNKTAFQTFFRDAVKNNKSFYVMIRKCDIKYLEAQGKTVLDEAIEQIRKQLYYNLKEIS